MLNSTLQAKLHPNSNMNSDEMDSLTKRQKTSRNEGFAFILYEKWDKQALSSILSRHSSLLQEDSNMNSDEMDSLTKRQKTSRNEGFAFILYEKWDKQALSSILSRHSSLLQEDGEVDHQTFTKLMAVSDSLTHDGILAVHYFHSRASAPFELEGRVYGTGFQTVPGWVRRLCAHKYYHDVDVVNCFPVILDQLAQAHKIDARYLRQYVEHREAILESDIEQVRVARETAKCQYLKLMFGSGELDYKTTFLVNFKADIQEVTEHLWLLKAYASHRMSAQANAAEQPNVKASFLSLLIQTEERKVVDAAIQTVRSKYKDYKVDT